jgi:2',3'-cyclic-nucleotide 2'-phosphodiesterase (5'-nucleotidase family)
MTSTSVTLVATLLLFKSLSTAEVNLPFGDINVVVVTDVHSWIYSHNHTQDHDPVLDATYGHVISFVEHLKALERDRDIWFVMNGDFIDGTGLSYNEFALTPILEQMPWDALTVGNHELYKDSTIELMTQPGGFIQWFGKKVITTNVITASTGLPLGHRYHFLKGKTSTTLVLGFLYEMEYGSTLKTVERVEDVIHYDWFQELLGKPFDAVLVLAHMDLKDPLVYTILDSIRQIKGTSMPVQFITGHTHYRGFAELDELSTSFEAGRYLDTIGFVSFPKLGNINGTFQHQFLDANTGKLAETLDIALEDLLTPKGELLIGFIDRTRSNLGLDVVIGCSPAHFILNSSLDDQYSLWGLYRDEVVPSQLFNEEKGKVLIQNRETSLRYDLYKGNITIDDIYVVNPFNESLYLVAESLPGAVIHQLNYSLNSGNSTITSLPLLPDFIIIGTVDDGEKYQLYTIGFDLAAIQAELQIQLGDTVITPFKTEISATQLWHDFVIQNWPNCSVIFDLGDNEDTKESSTPNSRIIIGIIGVSIVLALSGFLYAIIIIRKERGHMHFESDDLLFVTNDGGFHDDAGLMPREEGKFA